MSLTLERLDAAAELPELWDALAGEYYQTREFLRHTDDCNPCGQRYYLASEGGVLRAGLVVYTLKLDMFTYSRIRLPLSMNIAGIPCSVSASGCIGDPALLPELLEMAKQRGRGFLITLNLDSPYSLPQTICGPTLPTIVMDRSFRSWDAYLGSLRADYRSRLLRQQKDFAGVESLQTDCAVFTPNMYGQYLEVLSRSIGKLETLPYEFFVRLPKNFQLTACYQDQALLGWRITASWRDRLYFFLGGFDYSSHQRYSTYFNLLSGILDDSIAGGYSVLDLGQTAETPKLRLGGRIQHKWMLGYHTQWWVRRVLSALRGSLIYKEGFPPAHPFKEQL